MLCKTYWTGKIWSFIQVIECRHTTLSAIMWFVAFMACYSSSITAFLPHLSFCFHSHRSLGLFCHLSAVSGILKDNKTWHHLITADGEETTLFSHWSFQTSPPYYDNSVMCTIFFFKFIKNVFHLIIVPWKRTT